MLIISYLTDKIRHFNVKYAKTYYDINHYLARVSLKEIFSIIEQAK
jgi:predicted nucleotidyltransferase component of viral defense system